jgi:hypothetical protein
MNERPGLCVRNEQHRFAAASGWCLNGCGWRDDGKSALHARTAPFAELVRDVTLPLHPRSEQ